MAMLTYPFVAHWLFSGNSFQAGLFLGTSVHETAQVAGAGLVYEEYFEQGNGQALNVATVTKLVRNLGLLVVVPALSIYYHKQEQQRASSAIASSSSSSSSSLQRPSWWSMIPLFVFGFAGMSLVRSIGDMGLTSDENSKAFGVLSAGQWLACYNFLKQAAELCLGIAMAAVGLGTSYGGIRKIGGRPMLVGFFSAAVVGVVSIVMIKALY